MSILIVGPSWVGDMVMAQTLFQALKQQYPDKAIDVLAPAWSAPLLERMPEVSEAISMPLGHGELNLKKRYQLAKSLRAKNYDLAYVLPNSLKSSLIPFWTKIPKRIGWKGEWRYGLLNDIRTLDKTKYPLMIERFVALAYPKNHPLPRPIPHPKLTCHQDRIPELLKKYQLQSNGQPILALAPGAEFGPSKQWPSEYYAKVANALLSQGWQVWIFGSPNDQAAGDEINALCEDRCHNLAGRTSLADAIDLMSETALVVCNDSGLMHIAAALERPLIAVYGSTDPSFTPPLGDNVSIVKSDISCSPCFKRTCPLGHHRCMKELLPEQVLRMIDQRNLACAV